MSYKKRKLLHKRLQKQKNLEYKKELGRFKKFWDILQTTNQHHAK